MAAAAASAGDAGQIALDTVEMAGNGNGHGLVSDGLSSAEEIIDRQTTVDQIAGREFTGLTGRVLLHALAADGRGLCGRDSAELAPTGRSWDDRHLPHIPRCDACVTAAMSGDPAAMTGDPAAMSSDPAAVRSSPVDRPDAPPPGLPAAGVDIRLAHGSDSEAAGAAALREVLAEHDLRRWMFTDLVTVDADVRGGHSHPLTINPSLLVSSPARALAVFLHEQLHWVEGPGVDNAIAEVRRRWPDPPPPPAGCHDAESSWGHLIVCALEYQSLSELLGPSAAAAALAQLKHYAWVYDQVLGDPGWFFGLLQEHGVRLPEQPPVPRRYFGEEWWTAIP
jgi:hypothetical protein